LHRNSIGKSLFAFTEAVGLEHALSDEWIPLEYRTISNETELLWC